MLQGLRTEFALPIWVSIAVVVVSGLLASGVAVRNRRAGRPVLVPVARVLTVGAALLVVAATAVPKQLPVPWWGFGDLVWEVGRGLGDWRAVLEAPFDLAGVLYVGNVVLYVPVAFLGTIGWPSRRAGILVGCLGLSLLVETAQYFPLGRVAEINDVLLNLTGALIGYGTGLVLRRYRHGRQPRAAQEAATTTRFAPKRTETIR